MIKSQSTADPLKQKNTVVCYRGYLNIDHIFGYFVKSYQTSSIFGQINKVYE